MLRLNYFSLISVIVMTVCNPGPAQDLQEQAAGVINAYETGMNQKSVQQVLDQFNLHPEEMPQDMLKEVLKQGFEAAPDKTIHMQLHEVTRQGAMARAWVTTTTQKDGNSFDVNELFTFEPYEGQLKIASIYAQLDPNVYHPDTRVLTSTKGQYRLTVPAGWLALGGSGLLKGISTDSVFILAPDLKSKVILGLVQVPMKLADTDTETAHQAVMADVALTKRQTTNHKILDEGPIELAGLKGYQVKTTFTLPGNELYSRLRIYLSEKPLLYFFACDAIGAGQFGTLKPAFDTLLNSFSLMEPEEGMSRQETLAAEHASGAVAGRVYTSDEYNCFIAAPEGWEIRTSPNPAHLVEMQYANGKSLCRLLAVKGIPATMTAQKMFDNRLKTLQDVVQNFKEVTRKEVTVQGVTGIQSVQTFSLEGLGGFHVKELTLVKDGTYYLILCQCIEPDDYAVLEKDFDQIIDSFGFIQ